MLVPEAGTLRATRIMPVAHGLEAGRAVAPSHTCLGRLLLKMKL